MDGLRQGVGLRAYGQRDPLVEYKREVFTMFDNLMSDIKTEIANSVFRSTVSVESFEQFINQLPQQLVHDEVSVLGGGTRGGMPDMGAPPQAMPDMPMPGPLNMHPGIMAQAESAHSDSVPGYSGGDAKVGRNDPCPCGSGKKYKKCCGR